MILEELYIDDHIRYLSLPEWSQFFIKLGSWITQYNYSSKLTVGVALPTRAFAASLSAFGVVLSRANVPFDEKDLDLHFNNLLSLNFGTPLSYIERNKKKNGIFVGICDDAYGTRIKVQVQNQKGGNLTHLVDKAHSLTVLLSEQENVILPKNQTGRKVIKRKSFVDGILKQADACFFALVSRLECTIVGKLNHIRHETMETRFTIRSSKNQYEEGTLQDILRIKNFMGESKAFRTEIIPENGHHQALEQKQPAVVIFDGATSFLKWRYLWPNSHWIVFLDYTDPTFREAADLLNLDYIKFNGMDSADIKGLPYMPNDIESIVFKRS